MRALEWTRRFSEKTAETWRTNPHVLRLREKAESTGAKLQSNPLPTGLAAAALVGWVVCLFQWRRAARLKFALRRQRRVNEEAQAAQRALELERQAEKRSQEEAQETEEELRSKLEKETAARSRLQQYIAGVHVQLQCLHDLMTWLNQAFKQTMETEARQLAERASEQSSHNRELQRKLAAARLQKQQLGQQMRTLLQAKDTEVQRLRARLADVLPPSRAVSPLPCPDLNTPRQLGPMQSALHNRDRPRPPTPTDESLRRPSKISRPPTRSQGLAEDAEIDQAAGPNISQNEE